jgi:hypothetical protein
MLGRRSGRVWPHSDLRFARLRPFNDNASTRTAMSPTVRRRLLAFMLVALAWVWAVPGPLQPSAQGLAHELVHLQSVAHHHHDDASLQLDEVLAGEPSHQHASDAAKPLAWATPKPAEPGALPVHPLVAAAEPHALTVVLDAPLRPPRG